MGSSRFFSALAALLFLALSAWAAACVRQKAQAPETSELYSVTVSDSLELTGLAVRSEEPLSHSRGEAPPAGDFERLPAGEASKLPALYLADCDGWERLSPEDLQGLTVGSLEALLSSAPDKAGDARLVTGWAWYYGALTQDTDTELTPGPCLLLFDGFAQPEEARLISVSPAERGRRALVLRLTAGDRDSLSLRRTGAKLILNRYSGLKVPLSALKEDGDGCCVYTVSALGYEKQAADIIYLGGDFALISGQALREGLRVLIS